MRERIPLLFLGGVSMKKWYFYLTYLHLKTVPDIPIYLNRMRNYQQKKKGLSKQVFEILEAKGYLLMEEIRRNIQSGEYRTTLATNLRLNLE